MKNLSQVLIFFDQAAEQLPDGCKKYRFDEQLARERHCDEFRKQMKIEFSSARGTFDRLKARKQNLIDLLSGFFRTTLDYRVEETEAILSAEMVKASSDFVKIARFCDSRLALDDALQAIRNVWILNGLQWLAGSTPEITPSVFAYSMLYPYTDNFLDDPEVSESEKKRFGQRFERRLRGEPVSPAGEHEERIFRQVDYIEYEWPRFQHPQIYESLLAIHRAQSASVCLMQPSDSLGFGERLAIGIEKGGTSVVADGMLLFGELTAGREAFLYLYGAYLQLLDDWQDLSADKNAGVFTAFASAANGGYCDALLLKTWNLGLRVIEQAESAFDSPAVKIFQGLMRRSFDLFLAEAVLSNPGFFSASLRQQVSGFLPVRYCYLEAQKSTADTFKPTLLGLWDGRSARFERQPEFAGL